MPLVCFSQFPKLASNLVGFGGAGGGREGEREDCVGGDNGGTGC